MWYFHLKFCRIYFLEDNLTEGVSIKFVQIQKYYANSMETNVIHTLLKPVISIGLLSLDPWGNFVMRRQTEEEEVKSEIGL